jgi:hypothetical protein
MTEKKIVGSNQEKKFDLGDLLVQLMEGRNSIEQHLVELKKEMESPDEQTMVEFLNGKMERGEI